MTLGCIGFLFTLSKPVAKVLAPANGANISETELLVNYLFPGAETPEGTVPSKILGRGNEAAYIPQKFRPRRFQCSSNPSNAIDTKNSKALSYCKDSEIRVRVSLVGYCVIFVIPLKLMHSFR